MRSAGAQRSWLASICLVLCLQSTAIHGLEENSAVEDLVSDGRVLTVTTGTTGANTATTWKPKSPGKPAPKPANNPWKPKSPGKPAPKPANNPWKPKSPGKPAPKPANNPWKPKSPGKPAPKPANNPWKPKSPWKPAPKPANNPWKPKSPGKPAPKPANNPWKPKSPGKPAPKPANNPWKPKSPWKPAPKPANNPWKPKSPGKPAPKPANPWKPKSPGKPAPKPYTPKPQPKPQPPKVDPFKSRIPSPMVINGPYFFTPDGKSKLVAGPFPIKSPVYQTSCNGVTRKGTFIKGANIPYAYKTATMNTYGINFGDSYKRSLTGKNYQPAFWQEAYGNLQGTKSTLARIYIFADGRSSELWAKDALGNWRVSNGLSAKFFRDFGDMLTRAHKAGVQVMPTLLTYKIMMYREEPTWPVTAPIRRGFIVTDHNQTDIFMERIFKPLVQRFANHPGLHSWDCVNEPEQVMLPDPGSKPSTMFFKAKHADWAHWIGKCAAIVHQYSKKKVTFGGWDVRYICTKPEMGCFGSFWHDQALRKIGLPKNPELWPHAYLDFYAPHFYKEPSYLVGRPACVWGADKEIMVGETPNRGMWGPNYNPDKVLEYACKNGYMGLLFFSMYASQDDPSRHWSEFEPVLRQFDANTCTNSFPQKPWVPWPSPPLPSPTLPMLPANKTTAPVVG